MGELIKYTAQQYAAKFEPMAMLQDLRQIKTMTDAIKADPNGLAFYSKQIGEDTVLAVIEMHLLALGQSVNVHEKLSKFQIKEIATEIITLYYYMNMTEIATVFRRAKRGEFGPIKYALNMPDVLQWFAKYSDERVAHFMQMSDSQANEHKQNLKDSTQLDGMALEVLKNVKEEIPEEFDKESFDEWKKENKDLIKTKPIK